MRRLAFTVLVAVPVTAYAFSDHIVFAPTAPAPNAAVVATISGLSKNSSVHIDGVTVSDSKILVEATAAGGAICGPACGYSVEAYFNAPSRGGTYPVDYAMTFAGERSVSTIGQITVANACDFGHALAVDRAGVHLGERATLSWCNPSYFLTDAGYYVHSYRIYSARSADGPFAPLTDVSSADTTSAVITPAATGKTYYYVEAHGCEGAIVLCGPNAADTTMTTNIVAVDASIPGYCVTDATTLCLAQNRFAVSAHWRTSDGRSGDGRAVSLTNDSGYFWFFSSGNVEITTKILNACAFQPGSFWIFASGMTNVAVDIAVTDMQANATRHYASPSGEPFRTVIDTASFFCP